jgi:hypothetical protein
MKFAVGNQVADSNNRVGVIMRNKVVGPCGYYVKGFLGMKVWVARMSTSLVVVSYPTQGDLLQNPDDLIDLGTK